MALCQTQKSSNQVLEAMKWYFGARHCRTITFVDDSAGDQDGQYFDLNTFNTSYQEVKYVVLLSNGTTTTAPTNSDQTLITVTYTDDDDAATIAAAFVAELVAQDVAVRTEITGGEVEVQNNFVGTITSEITTNASNLTFAVGKEGFGGYIGQVGESELTTTIDVVQLLDDAQGTTVLEEVITGYNAEISIPLREMTTQRWKTLIGNVSGNNITIDTKEITGWGTKKLYDGMFQYSGRLVGHPVRNEDSNIDEDVTMLLTAPKMNSINFSGGAIQEADFLFTSYKDANAPDEINLVARGDHSKF